MSSLSSGPLPQILQRWLSLLMILTLVDLDVFARKAFGTDWGSTNPDKAIWHGYFGGEQFFAPSFRYGFFDQGITAISHERA